MGQHCSIDGFIRASSQKAVEFHAKNAKDSNNDYDDSSSSSDATMMITPVKKMDQLWVFKPLQTAFNVALDY